MRTLDALPFAFTAKCSRSCNKNHRQENAFILLFYIIPQRLLLLGCPWHCGCHQWHTNLFFLIHQSLCCNIWVIGIYTMYFFLSRDLLVCIMVTASATSHFRHVMFWNLFSMLFIAWSIKSSDITCWLDSDKL